MARLIWKELRERRLWALFALLATLGLTMIRGDYNFANLWQPFDPVFLVGYIASFLLGASMYANELKNNTDIFLLAKPYSRVKLFAAKYIAGAIVILLGLALSAAYYRLTCPAEYQQFADFGSLAQRVLFAAGHQIVVFYSAGAACSFVFPGVGGAIVCGALSLFMFIAITAVTQSMRNGAPNPNILFFGSGVMLVALAALMFRLDVSFNVARRLKLYMLMLAALAGTVIISAETTGTGIAYNRTYSVGPGGKFAVSTENYSSYDLIRLSDGRRWHIFSGAYDIPIWVGGSTVEIEGGLYKIDANDKLVKVEN